MCGRGTVDLSPAPPILGMFNSCRPHAKLSKPGGGPGLVRDFLLLGSLSRVTWVTKSNILLLGTGTPLTVNWQDALSHPSLPPGLFAIIFSRALARSGTPLGRTLANCAKIPSLPSSSPASSSSSSSSSSSPYSDGGTASGDPRNIDCRSGRRAAFSRVNSFVTSYLLASWSGVGLGPVIFFAREVPGFDKTSSRARLSAVILSTLGSDRAPPGRKGSC